MERRPTGQFWRFLPYPFYVLAALIGLGVVAFVGAALGLWHFPLPNDR